MDNAHQQAAKDKLKQVLKYLSPFDEDTLEAILGCFTLRAVKKNAILLAEGDTCKTFYFIYKGCIRTYFITHDGDEKTRYVMTDASIGTALTSFISQQPSFETLDALEDSELLCISHADFYRLNEELPEWGRFYKTILEMAYTFQNNRIASMVTLTAKERYMQLMKENPALIQRLTNKVLASYLDIRQETLSRLKPRG